MKNAKNELLSFVGGAAMLAVGLFILSQKVFVSSTFFGMGMVSIGGFNINSGLVIIPFIIGIVWMFVTSSFASKVFTVLSVIWIIVSIIMSTRLHLATISLFEWILILVLIFGGAGLVARVLFASNKKDARGNKKGHDTFKNETNYIEKQLKKMKNNKK